MKTIVIKISGELFSSTNSPTLNNVLQQIKKLSQNKRHSPASGHSPAPRIGLVLGGGNFFRGAQNKKDFGITENSAHTIGMLATMANGVLFHDLCSQQGISSTILSAFQCPSIAQPIRQDTIENAFNQKKIILFVGGTGNPFFTTDTNAVLRALQIEADEIWKATKVDGVYDADPVVTKDAKLLPTLTHQEVLDKNLGVMDKTAIILAHKHNVPIRVFNMFTAQAFCQALENPEFGSTIR